MKRVIRVTEVLLIFNTQGKYARWSRILFIICLNHYITYAIATILKPRLELVIMVTFHHRGIGME